MFKKLLIAVISISGLTAQAQQEWSFAATAPTKEACAKQVVKNLLGDARFTDLNNLSVDGSEGILLSGLGNLGIYNILSKDKNGWDYKVSLYLNLVSNKSSVVCSVGMDKGFPYPFTIHREDSKEKVFSLKCAAQGQALNCPA